jgi:DNA-binding transcriptional LysR family regulator
MVLEAARLGQGLALVPLFLVEQELQDGRLVRACPQTLEPHEAYYLIRRPTILSAPATLFRSWLIKQSDVALR